MRMVSKAPRLVYLLIILVIILACNMPLISNTGKTSTATNSPQPTLPTITSTPLTSSPTSTATVPTLTATPAVTNTATAVPNTPTNTAVPVACNKAQFVSDITYPDGTSVIIGSNFKKTWRLMNTGTCDWTSGYRLIFNSGDQMGAPNETVLTSGNIPAGATADISVDLKAPDTVGNYKGYFKMKSPDNVVFGIGNSGADAFWVEINTMKILSIEKPQIPNLQFFPSNTPTPKYKLVPGSIPKIIGTISFP